MNQIISGVIGFENQRIKCITGVHEHERLEESELIVTMKVEVDFAQCAQTDHLNDTLDYVLLTDLCREIAQRKYHLLEAYAFAVLDNLLNVQGVLSAWIQVKKPTGLPNVEHAIVEFSRRKFFPQPPQNRG